ncbi:MAG: type II toxin-antitoxin system VapC family toxin, partial [Thaumarchaeota archaeon]|nr:type II toxin-antitoxin system VapC family toxin [Nitrososphaerota archaeon]
YNQVIDGMRADEIVTSVVVLYEVYKKVKKVTGEEEALEAVAVLSQTSVVPVDEMISLEAGDYSLEHGLHFADALVYATARHWDAELYTSDEQLRQLKYVTFV